ncbi:uncharacterized protein B0H64DRAFT_371660 [Chaetomium fimeti]|uniref:EF-hand domain-containing protein n=1 Tax=Chaetomium fimeti TaxID=1854472 RepID=A0AAE0HMI1_9PEZI|nr:hypothetical protein B0H64DRAFT_371660 [Chaetomium fimeti]
MPTRRRPPSTTSTTTPKPSTSTSTTTTPRPSKLAKEHALTAAEEAELHEAFSLFAEPMDGEEPYGVMPISDVRRALIALGLPPSSPAQLAEFASVLDPDEEGFATYEAFVGVCALQLHARRDAAEAEAAGDEGGAHAGELEEAGLAVTMLVTAVVMIGMGYQGSE